jgi:phage gp29-like protein
MKKDIIVTNPNDAPAKPDYTVRADGTLDLAGYVAELMPATDEVLISLGGNLKEYARLFKDDQVASLMQQRQDALIAAEWVVEPGGEESRDVEAADFMRDQLRAVSFDRATRKMHSGVIYGYSVAECLYAPIEGKVHLVDIRVRKPWRFGFSPAGELRLKLPTGTTALMPPRKFWTCAFGADDDDTPYGRGLGAVLWWPAFLKRNGARFWASYLDRYGIPSTRATYPVNATDEDKRKALEAAVSLRNESAVAVPEGFKLELVEAASKGQGDFSAFLSYWDDAIARAILSQTGTSKIGQYSGTAEVHNEVRYEVLKSDADLLCESFNAGPMRWLTEWNFPGAAAPKVWRKVENRKKTEAEQSSDKNLYGMGLELSDEAIQNRYAGEWQRRAAAAPTEPGEKPSAPAFAEGERPYTDTLAEQLDAMTMDAQSAMLDSVRDLMDQALAEGGDMAAFAERLLSIYPLPGVEDLQKALAGALAASRLAGMAGAADAD